MSKPSPPSVFLSPSQFLAHWQGHRRVTRRVIEAFPEGALFGYRVEPMRPFGEIALELLAMAAPMVRGVVTGDWEAYAPPEAATHEELLRLWDEATNEIDELWPQIPTARFQERTTAFGQYEDVGRNLFLYVIDNEIHHRGQGYVYLRALGVEPPAFWERD